MRNLLTNEEEQDMLQVDPVMQKLLAQQEVSTPVMDDGSLVNNEMSVAQELEREVAGMQASIPEMQQTSSKLDQYKDLLAKAQQKRDSNLLTSNLLLGANQIAQGFARGSGAQIGVGEEAVRALQEQANLPVQQINEKLKADSDLTKLQLEQEVSDPNSPLAQQQKAIVDQLAKEAGINLPQSGPMSAKAQEQQMRSLAYILGNRRQAEQAELNRQQRLQELMMRFKEQEEARKDKQELQKEAKLDKQLESMSKRLDSEQVISRNNSIENINDYLTNKFGVNLKSSDKDLKKVDVEGIGMLGQLRPDFLTDKEDVSFRQNVSSLANLLLKSRSGAAVTDQEYNRFLKEVGSGNFSTEANLLSGLKKMQKDIEDQNKNIGKIYGKDVLEEYQSRTGIKLLTESDSASKGASGLTPEQRRKRIQELKAKQGK